MAEGLQGEKLHDCSEWLYDASAGTHRGVTPDGNAVLMLVADPEAAKRIIKAFDHWHSHACEESIVTGMFLLSLIGAHFSQLDL